MTCNAIVMFNIREKARSYYNGMKLRKLQHCHQLCNGKAPEFPEQGSDSYKLGWHRQDAKYVVEGGLDYPPPFLFIPEGKDKFWRERVCYGTSQKRLVSKT